MLSKLEFDEFLVLEVKSYLTDDVSVLFWVAVLASSAQILTARFTSSGVQDVHKSSSVLTSLFGGWTNFFLLLLMTGDSKSMELRRFFFLFRVTAAPADDVDFVEFTDTLVELDETSVLEDLFFACDISDVLLVLALPRLGCLSLLGCVALLIWEERITIFTYIDAKT